MKITGKLRWRRAAYKPVLLVGCRMRRVLSRSSVRPDDGRRTRVRSRRATTSDYVGIHTNYVHVVTIQFSRNPQVDSPTRYYVELIYSGGQVNMKYINCCPRLRLKKISTSCTLLYYNIFYSFIDSSYKFSSPLPLRFTFVTKSNLCHAKIHQNWFRVLGVKT